MPLFVFFKLLFPGDVATFSRMHFQGNHDLVGTRFKASFLRPANNVHDGVVVALHNRFHGPYAIVHPRRINDLDRFVDDGVVGDLSDGDDLDRHVYLVFHDAVF